MFVDVCPRKLTSGSLQLQRRASHPRVNTRLFVTARTECRCGVRKDAVGRWLRNGRWLLPGVESGLVRARGMDDQIERTAVT